MIHEYRCSGKCNDIIYVRFDLLEEVVDEIECKKCKSKAKRLEVPSSFNFQLKGSGFYSTDNRTT